MYKIYLFQPMMNSNASSPQTQPEPEPAKNTECQVVSANVETGTNCTT